MLYMSQIKLIAWKILSLFIQYFSLMKWLDMGKIHQSVSLKFFLYSICENMTTRRDALIIYMSLSFLFLRRLIYFWYIECVAELCFVRLLLFNLDPFNRIPDWNGCIHTRLNISFLCGRDRDIKWRKLENNFKKSWE